GKEVARIRDRRDGDLSVDGVEQADPCLFGDVLAVVLEIALESEAIGPVVEAGAGELAVAAEPVHAVLESRRRAVEAQAQLPFVTVAPADIERATELAKVADRAAEAGDVVLAGALRDHVDDARRARHAELERVGALQRLEARLVLVGHGDDAGDRYAPVEAIVGEEIELDPADVDRVVGAAL